MLKNINDFFSKKYKEVQDKIDLKFKTEDILTGFLKEEILKGADIDYQLSFVVNDGVIKIRTDNKIIAQEIALKISFIEKKLRGKGVKFKKLII